MSRQSSLKPERCLQVRYISDRYTLPTPNIGDEYQIKNFPSDNSKLAEMEFYLVDDLECDLVVFHPYRTLLALCGKEVGALPSLDAEAGELGFGVDEGPRYWGTGEGKLEIQDSVMQIAWYVIHTIWFPICPQ
jgi:cyclin C